MFQLFTYPYDNSWYMCFLLHFHLHVSTVDVSSADCQVLDRKDHSNTRYRSYQPSALKPRQNGDTQAGRPYREVQTLASARPYQLMLFHVVSLRCRPTASSCKRTCATHSTHSIQLQLKIGVRMVFIICFLWFVDVCWWFLEDSLCFFRAAPPLQSPCRCLAWRSSALYLELSSHGNIIILTSQWGCHGYNLDITWL